MASRSTTIATVTVIALLCLTSCALTNAAPASGKPEKRGAATGTAAPKKATKTATAATPKHFSPPPSLEYEGGAFSLGNLFSMNWWLHDGGVRSVHLSYGELFENIGRRFFPAQSTHNINDFIWVIPGALLVTIVRVVFESVIANPIGRLLGLKGKRVKKCAEQQWFLFLYGFMFAAACVILPGQKFFYNTWYAWDDIDGYLMTASFKFYYLIELSFYWSAITFHVLYDARRGDFIFMLLHHAVTIALITFSYLFGYSRIGAIILFLHDFADIFVSCTKIAHYLQLELISAVFFVGMLLSWAVSRLYVYPVWVLWSVFIESHTVSGTPTMWHGFCAMLFFLQVLHVYWFWLFVKMAFNMLRAGHTEGDIRSESDTDEDEDDKKKK